ncbi:MAG TPA: type IV pilus twitching motility protein PilT [Myxococcota bacterium]|nr:type IV pilus twitching motility protein PilT [Myxococcota bacterium]
MSQSKPIPLVARLALQLKMLSQADVERALAESRASGNPKLAQVFLQMGLLDREQIAKLQQVQKDLVEKHRAKKDGGATDSPPAAAPAAEARPLPQARPRKARDAASIHDAAGHAARAASPMTARDVEALRETPPKSPPPTAPATPEPTSDPVDLLFDEPSSAKPAPTPPPAKKAPSVTPPVCPSPAPSVAAPAPASSPAASAPPASAPSPAASAPPASAPSPAATGSSEPEFEGRVSLELPVPAPSAGDRERLESLLSAGVAAGASDVHLHAGGPLKQRVHGELVVTEEAIDPALVERMVAASLTPEQRVVLSHDGEIDFCLDLPGIGRFRANAYRQQRGLDVVFRSVPATPPTLEELGLPAELKKYTDFHQGMVLITGPAGCGKSATLAALVNHINETRDDHILTVEDPIEIIHPSKRCLVNQRYAGHHTKSFSRALRGALREDPDIIVIGELRDLETISLAMTAAETGHFVLATLHTANAVRTVNRMIGAFPSNEQDQVRAMLSESLRAVLSQRLVPTADGQGRVPALELLVINRAIGNLIRDEKTVQIRSSMQTGKAHGMYLLEQSLNELVAAGRITREVALEYAEEQKLITAGA